MGIWVGLDWTGLDWGIEEDEDVLWSVDPNGMARRLSRCDRIKGKGRLSREDPTIHAETKSKVDVA